MVEGQRMPGFTQSLWYRTIDDPPAFQSLAADATADVAIIGAGITGLSAALRLASTGSRVVVLEAAEPGAGASGRNGGFVVPHFARSDPDRVIERWGEAGERLVELVGNSASALYELIRDHSIVCDAAQGGWYQPTRSAAGLAVIERRARQWEARGQPVKLHDRQETARLTGCAGYLGSWSHACGGTVHPLKLVHGLANAAMGHGASIFARTVVTALTRAHGLWNLATASGSVRAPSVLVCTNALSRGLFPELRRAVAAVDICQAATAPLPPSARAHLLGQGQCLSDTQINLFTYRFDASWRLISGSFMLRPGMSVHGVARRIARRLHSMLGLAAEPRIEFAWSGQASVGRDFLPALYELAPGILAGTGCNGRGVALSAQLGRIMADLAGGAPRAQSPVPVRPAALGRWSPWARWGVRYYPLYGLIKDRLDRAKP